MSKEILKRFGIDVVAVPQRNFCEGCVFSSKACADVANWKAENNIPNCVYADTIYTLPNHSLN